MRETSTVACNERIISTIYAMVMAAAPSAATGATGLERLLLIFLMKLDESQNAANNTYFSDERFSDQSVKLRETPQENSRTPRTSKETCNSTRNHHFSHEKPNEPKNSNLTERISRKQQKTSLHRTETQTIDGKREITEQNLNEQRTTTQKTTKTSKNSRCGWEQVLHGPTVGA